METDPPSAIAGRVLDLLRLKHYREGTNFQTIAEKLGVESDEQRRQLLDCLERLTFEKKIKECENNPMWYALVENPEPRPRDWFDEDDKFVPEWLGREILARMDIVTMRDSREMYCYDREEGLWKPNAHALVEETCTRLLGQSYKKHHVEEVLYFIRTSTFKDRSVFDMPLNLIPLKNGVLDMQTIDVRAYSEGDYFLTKIPVDFDPKAECPSITKFLSEIVPGEKVKLLKQVAAYCMHRSYPIQKAVMLVGDGSNGKSVFLGLLKNFLGSENVAAHSLQDIEFSRFTISNLYQKLANIYPDISVTALTTTGRFKMATGGDMITAERKFGQPFNFVNYAKLIFSCNQMPTAV